MTTERLFALAKASMAASRFDVSFFLFGHTRSNSFSEMMQNLETAKRE
jgi:hypothetical protein